MVSLSMHETDMIRNGDMLPSEYGSMVHNQANMYRNGNYWASDPSRECFHVQSSKHKQHCKGMIPAKERSTYTACLKARNKAKQLRIFTIIIYYPCMHKLACPSMLKHLSSA